MIPGMVQSVAAVPLHHPGEALLTDYAAGTLGEAAGLVVATHLALCPSCRADVAQLEAVGGALLETLPEAAVDDSVVACLLARLDAPASGLAAPAGKAAAHPILPEPLRSYAGGDVTELGWKRIMRVLEEVPVPCGSGRARLMRIRAGAALPSHTHKGNEFTLVLAGGFSDALGHYLRGDFVATDASVDHKPVADPGPDCICLAVTDAPLRLTGPLGRLVNPFLKL